MLYANFQQIFEIFLYKGMMCGLTLERSQENLAVTFLAMIQALAYGTNHILQELQGYFQI